MSAAQDLPPCQTPLPSRAAELPADIRCGATAARVIDQAVRTLHARGALRGHAERDARVEPRQ